LRFPTNSLHFFRRVDSEHGVVSRSGTSRRLPVLVSCRPFWRAKKNRPFCSFSVVLLRVWPLPAVNFSVSAEVLMAQDLFGPSFFLAAKLPFKPFSPQTDFFDFRHQDRTVITLLFSIIKSRGVVSIGAPWCSRTFSSDSTVFRCAFLDLPGGLLVLLIVFAVIDRLCTR